ncbi:hypothetical protein NA78x_001595 [Anatilimnocola sp. NA78]|uniref:hypothetical protein n=1 Tax=Anatilimnocola sp. NA78 TaxID=3415683 RepID=UPI003CE4605A
MKRWLGLMACVLLIGAVAWTWTRSGSNSSGLISQATAGDASPPAIPPESLIVHEWGTFTSYSGSDGGKLEFRPLFDDDLPGFVQDRAGGANFLSKVSYRALVRMETPITYFYTDRPRDVRVRVRFPQGLLTEFYPPATVSPPYKGSGEPQVNSALDWGTVRLIPEEYLRPKLADARLASIIQQRTAAALPPIADYNNHYAYARQTDSALVYVEKQGATHFYGSGSKDHFEKFLFYRGLGGFKLPIKIVADGNGQATINTNGRDPITWMMLLEVVGEQVRFTISDGVDGGQTKSLKLPAQFSDKEAMLARLTEALVGTGLYRREAEAMVNTWRSSWFGEEGTRLLYFVPERLTNELLPLEIEPQPTETVRVLVGRMDLMTPEQEKQVAQLVKASYDARLKFHKEQQEGTRPADQRYELPKAVRQLGRLAEPALVRIQHTAGDLDIVREAESLKRELIAAIQAEEAAKK